MGGKRKERDEDTGIETHGSTLFISNIPYTATSTDIQTLFSDIAPLRTAFVVSDKQTKKPKGVGYVSFAVKEDAETAFEVLAKGETVLDGRVLRAEWAGRANKEKRVNGDGETDGPSPKKPRQVVRKTITEEDKMAIRTIVISGLPEKIDSKPLWKKVRKYEGVESIEYPLDDAPNTAHALFETPAQAMRAAEKLHAHVFKGSMLSVILKKRHDSLVKAKKSTGSKSQVMGKDPSKNSRLIVRNLPWNITEHNLRTIFLPYGPIHSVTLPTVAPEIEPGSGDGDEGHASPSKNKPKSKAKTKTRGFAFVWFLSRKDAEKAIECANDALVKGGLNGGIIKPKGREGDGVKEEDARVIAVDWALSKERWEAEKAKGIEDEEKGDKSSDDEGIGGEGELEDDEDEGSSEEEEENAVSSSDAEGAGVHEDDNEDNLDEGDYESSEGGSEEGDDDSGKKDEDIRKPTLPTPADGTTLFIRNVPFDATEEELRTLFKVHGPLRYARLTMDNSTSPPRPRGTAFVCFWKKEDAQSVLDLADSVRRTAVGTVSGTSKGNPFSMSIPSLLTPDPSAGVARNLVLNGRTLDVVRAVERDEAGKLLSDGVRKRRKEDKRNVYLLKEGVITPSSPIAHTLSPADLSARVDSYNSRRNMLNSNPSLYVSKTRLSVRQLPRWVTVGVLKRLAKHAISMFKKEVRECTREGLTPEEMAVDQDSKNEKDEGEGENEEKMSKKQKRKLKDGPVIQSKIVRDSAKVDPLVGGPGKRVSGRSKGYAFLELALHADALRVLRWCNNNHDAEGVMREFWKAELERIVEVGKEKEKAKPNDEDEERTRVIRAKLKELEEESIKGYRSSSRRLIVEFSIENIQVVKRRTEKIHGEGKERKQPIKRKSMLDGSFSRDEKDGDYKKNLKSKRDKNERDQAPRSTKRPRPIVNEGEASTTAHREGGTASQFKMERKQSEAVEVEKKKLGRNMGSLIGRKRKERREKRTKNG